jgi:RNA polymerase sigma-70 factor, ECF subfamily
MTHLQINNFNIQSLLLWQPPSLWFAALFRKKERVKLNEDELVALAMKNPRHFSKLYDLYHHKIYCYVYRRVGDYDTAADVTSETFIKAFANINKYQFQGFGFSSWLYKIATNELNLFFRKHETETRHISIYSKTIELLTEIDLDTTLEEKLAYLQQILSELELQEVQLLEWRFYEELSFKEIGFLMEITEDNAKVRTYRVIDKVRKRLNKKQFDQ